jgi:tetratricopeptide (TPR) repeat protein
MDAPTILPSPGTAQRLKLSIFNPHRLSDADLARSFIAHQAIFRDILEDIAAEAPDSRAQHHLVVGQRGMGKTTLLRRIAIELRREPHRQHFLPLTFPEDQYVEVDRLSKFWLNGLDALADALEQQVCPPEEVKRIDATVAGIVRAGGEEEAVEAAARDAFAAALQRLSQRLVLLIDNFSLLVGRLKDHDYALRGFFSAAGAPILVGASPTMPVELEHYDAAFYDGFKSRVLRPLSLDELADVIAQLARTSGRDDLAARLASEKPRLAALRDLTGGNPRTAVLLFDLFAKGFSEDAFEDLESLLDVVTPLYQSRLDQLSEQGQVIVVTLARNWGPMTAAAVVDQTRIPSSSVSPQLGRLEGLGLVEKAAVFPDKKTGYQVAERFLNIWYLMRFSTRRQRASLAHLTRFLQEFHTPAQLESQARGMLARGEMARGRVPYAMALADALEESPALAHQLEVKAELELLKQTEGVRERIAEILDPDEIDSRIFSFAELQRALRQAVPPGSVVTGEEFADLVLGSPAMLPGDKGRPVNRHTIASSPLDAAKVGKVVRQLREEMTRLETSHGAEITRWLASQLRGGLITAWDDAQQVSLAILDAGTEAAVSLVLDFASAKAKAGLREDAFVRVRPILAPTEEADAWDWFKWGSQLHRQFCRCEEAESAYRKAIALDPTHAAFWNNLGWVLTGQPGRYEQAESAYRKAIELDPHYALPWRNLGWLQESGLGRYDEAESAYLKAIEIDPQDAALWNGLGNLLGLYLGRYEDAESAYRKAIEIDPRYALAWNNLGNLLADHLGQFDEARGAFAKALELDPNEDMPRLNLAFLLRDFLGQPGEARQVLAGLRDRETLKDTQALHEALFAAYDENWGLSAQALRKALSVTEFRLPRRTRDDWFRASAVLLHLGYGPKLVEFLQAEGADIKMLPWFVAVSAHAQGDRRYLSNAPAEARAAAEQIFDEIQRRRDRLPKRVSPVAHGS